MNKTALIKFAITTASLLLILLHIVRPTWKIDAITLGLILVATLPWVYTIIESAKFPGGWEIKFRDVQRAAEKIAGSVVSITASTSEGDSGVSEAVAPVQQTDPNLALVSLRIELERRLRALAAHNLISPFALNTREVLSLLINQQIIPASVGKGIDELLALGERAAHGAKVDGNIALWASTSGNAILRSLDSLLPGT